VSVSYGVLFYGFSVLITDKGAGGEFSSTVLSSAYGGAVLSAGAAAPLVGRVADRFGVRWIIAGGSVAAGFGIALFARSTLDWHALAVWWLVLGPAMAMTLYEPAYVAIQQWYAPPDRPRAIAVLTLAAGLSCAIFIPATGFLLDEFGWRNAATVLAALFVLGAGAALLAVPRGTATAPDRVRDSATGWRSQLSAFRRPRLMVFTLGAILAYGTLEANVIHRIARFEDAGLSVTVVTYWAALSGFLTLPGRFLLPMLGGRYRAARLLAGVLLVLSAATAFMIDGSESWQMVAYFWLFGLVFGAALPLRAVVMSQWHPTARGFGTLLGLQAAMIAVARAGGPPLVGLLRELGGYALPMMLLTFAFALAAVLVVLSESLHD